MEIILIVYLVVSIALIGIILLQQGKGAEMGASFGAGGANTVFGAAGSGNVLTKATTILTILFFAIALSISYLNSEPTIATDNILDEVGVSVPAETISLESQLPVEDGLAAEVAPVVDGQSVETTVTEQVEATQKEADQEAAESEEAAKSDIDSKK